MAAEISPLTVALTFTKASAGVSSAIVWSESNLNRDVAGGKVIQNIQIVGLAAEQILIGDIGTLGYVMLKNVDPTNFITLRNGSGGADVIKMIPGDIAVFRAAASTIFALADTAPALLRVLAIEL